MKPLTLFLLVVVFSGCRDLEPPNPTPNPAPAPDPKAPSAVIQGPSSAVAGELIKLSADGSFNATNFTWKQHINSPNEVQLKLEPINGGRQCLVSSFPGVHRIQLIVSNRKGHDDAWHTIRISGQPGPNPNPNPGPNPNPDPDPTPPEPDLTDFAKFIYDEALKVKSRKRSDEARTLAAELEAVASEASKEPSRYKSEQDIANAVGEAFQKTTGRDWSAFASTMREELARRHGLRKPFSWWSDHCNQAALGLKRLPASEDAE